jgi:hypothetical protein
MKNLLLEKVEYQVVSTSLGVWRRFLYPSGALFAEFTSHRSLFGLPLLRHTRGICPETGKRRWARGVVAVGRFAAGFISIGQVSLGIVALGQLGLGLLLGLGQGAVGLAAVGQLAVCPTLALGQIGVGYAAVAQMGLGKYVLAQVGYGEHIWDYKGADPQAVAFFQALWQGIKAGRWPF